MNLLSKAFTIVLLGFAYLLTIAAVEGLVMKWPPDSDAYYVALMLFLILFIGLLLATYYARILWRTPYLKYVVIVLLFVDLGLLGLDGALAFYPSQGSILAASVAFVGIAGVLKFIVAHIKTYTSS